MGPTPVRRRSTAWLPALTLVAVLLVVATPAGAAAVVVSIPDDLAIAPGGEVEVPLVLVNDVTVRALFANIQDAPDEEGGVADELALVSGSSACSTRAGGGFSCPATELLAQNLVTLFVLDTGTGTIAPGSGAVMTLRLRDVGTPCTAGTSIKLKLSGVKAGAEDNEPLDVTAIDGKVRCAADAPTPTATKTVTPTPTATAAVTGSNGPVTPTATVTSIGPITPTATPTVPTTAATTVTATATAVFATTTPSPTPTTVATPAFVSAARAKAIDKCQKAINAGAAKLVTAKMKALDGCAARIFKCVQTLSPGAKRDTCIARAGTRCTGRLFTAVSTGAARLRATLVGKCKSPALVPDDVLAELGIGYEGDVADACAVGGITLDDVSDVAVCVAAHHGCRAEQLFLTRTPRIGELLRVAGVAPNVRAELTCTADLGGDGAGIGGNDAAGKALLGCANAIGKASTKFVATKLKSLASCVGRVFTCTQLKPGDPACLLKVAPKCDAAFGTIATAEAKLRATITTACGASTLPFANVAAATGMDVEEIGTTCASFDVASLATIGDYATCVLRQHECLVEDLLGFEAPRAAELLPLVGRELVSPFCP